MNASATAISSSAPQLTVVTEGLRREKRLKGLRGMFKARRLGQTLLEREPHFLFHYFSGKMSGPMIARTYLFTEESYATALSAVYFAIKLALRQKSREQWLQELAWVGELRAH